MEELKEIIEILNPWWKDDKISDELAKPYKRRSLPGFLNYLNTGR